MPRGGYRPGAGRKAGSLNRATVERRLRAKQGLAAAATAGLLPLDVLLARMRGDPLPNGKLVTDEQFQAAVAAAPFIHPRLASTDATIRSANVHYVVADEPLSVEEWVAKFAATANCMATGTVLAEQLEAAD